MRRRTNVFNVHAASILVMSLVATALGAQEADGGGSAASANHPLADATAFNIQDYFIGDRTERDDIANQLSVADDGAGWPEWQIFAGVSTQFIC